MYTTQQYIRKVLGRKKEGDLVFPTNFRGHGTETSIRKALSRLVQEGTIRRLGHGIYYLPKNDPVLGELRPSAEEVAEMLAKKEKVRIRPAGSYALHRLGLTTQVPTRLVYITDGVPRNFKVGKMPVTFKATTPKKLSMTGEISSLVIQALEELDLDHIDETIQKRIQELLMKEDPRKLKHDLILAPASIHDFILKLLKKEKQNDRMAAINR